MHAPHCGIVAAAVGFVFGVFPAQGEIPSSLWQSPRNLEQPAKPLAGKRGVRLFVIGFPVEDLERAVDLLEQHDAENLVGKRGLAKGKAEIRAAEHLLPMPE